MVDGINHDSISLASLDNDFAGVVISSYDNTSQENLADNASVEFISKAGLWIGHRVPQGDC